ncbi:MAG: FHA domain-containing protein [Anaerolineae bacterium]|nr:FHA domain-containing protein [Anaerolineae bacterium]
MSLAVVLLILRLVGALILLAFLAFIAWLIYLDVRNATRVAAAQEEPHGLLRLLDGDAGRVYPLGPVTSIGRAPGNSIVLGDSYASNEHALLMLRGRQWWVEDLNSRNGTLLNGQRLEAATIISPGDVLTIGNSELKLEALPVEGQ